MFIGSGVIFSRGWVRKDGNLLTETGCRAVWKLSVVAAQSEGGPMADEDDGRPGVFRVAWFRVLYVEGGPMAAIQRTPSWACRFSMGLET